MRSACGGCHGPVSYAVLVLTGPSRYLLRVGRNGPVLCVACRTSDVDDRGGGCSKH